MMIVEQFIVPRRLQGALRGALSSPPELSSRCPLRSQPGQRVLHPLLMGAPRDSRRPSPQLHPLPAALAGRLGAGDHGIQHGEPFGRYDAVIQLLCPPGLDCTAGAEPARRRRDGHRRRPPRGWSLTARPQGYHIRARTSSDCSLTPWRRSRVNVRLRVANLHGLQDFFDCRWNWEAARPWRLYEAPSTTEPKLLLDRGTRMLTLGGTLALITALVVVLIVGEIMFEFLEERKPLRPCQWQFSTT